MKRAFLITAIVILVVSAFSTPTAADHEWDHRYVINGEVSELSGDSVSGLKAEVDCSPGATDASICQHNVGRDAKTNDSGIFSLQLHVHSGDDGKLVVLLIDGQQFTHTFDLNGPDGNPTVEDREVTLEFKLDHDVSNTEKYVIIFLFLATIVAPSIYFLRKYLSPS
jgi:hypothetical protein